MSNKFLGATNAGNLADGTVLIYASSLGASGLNPSYPVKTNSLRQLVSSKLNISDINNLQDTLDNVLTNPFAGTLHVTDLETANHFSLNDELNKIDNITSATQGPAVTNISGLVSVQEISTDRIYNTAQTIWVDMDTNTVDVSATNLKLNGNNVITTPYSGQLEASSFKKTGGTGIEYLMANGSTLTQSANSGNSNFYLYNNSVLQTMPISGSITYNNTDPLLAIYVYLSNITRDAIDILVFFKQINQLNDLYIQDQESSLNFIKYNITGTPIISATYIAIPVIKTTSGGDSSFGSKPVMVSFFTNNLEIDTRLSAVETKTQNQTATAQTTTFAPGTTVVCETIQPNVIKTSEINTVVLDGTMSVGTYSGNINLGRAGKTMTIQSDLLVANVINSTSSYAPDVYSDNIWADKVDTNTVYPLNIGTVNSSIITLGKAGQNTVVNSDNLIANKFFKFGGLSTEFLKANGTVDSNTYISTSGLFTPSGLGSIDIMLRDSPFIGLQYNNGTGVSTLSNTSFNQLGNTATSASTYATTNNFTRQLCCANWTTISLSDGVPCGYSSNFTNGARVSSGFNFGLSAVLGISDSGYNANNCQNFWGLWNTPNAIPLNQTTQLSVQRNMICFGSDTNDPNICIYTAGASSTVKQVDLGASFPANRPVGASSTDWFKFTLYWDLTNIYYKAHNTTTNVIVSGSFAPLASDMPITSIVLFPQCVRIMGSPQVSGQAKLQVQRFGVYY